MTNARTARMQPEKDEDKPGSQSMETSSAIEDIQQDKKEASLEKNRDVAL